MQCQPIAIVVCACCEAKTVAGKASYEIVEHSNLIQTVHSSEYVWINNQRNDRLDESVSLG